MDIQRLISITSEILKYMLFGCCLPGMIGFFTACDRAPEVPASPAYSADGTAIHYQVHGAGAQSLVFVHGWGGDHSYWDQQIQHFSRDYNVVTIDLAGHGKSELNRDDWTMEAFGMDVTAVVEKLDLDTVILIGHSMGGPVIVEAAQHMPDRIIGLVGVDTFHDIDREAGNADEVETLLQPLIENFPETTESFVRANMFTAASDSSLIEQISLDMASIPPEVGVPAIRNLYLRKESQGLDEIPVLLKLINSDIQATNFEAAERYGVDVLQMSDVGHFIMIEDPETFNRLLSVVIKGFAADPGN